MPFSSNMESQGLFGRSRSKFLQDRPHPITFRLEVREENSGMFLPQDEPRGFWRNRRQDHRLISYISAGGMRDMQPSRHADQDQSRRRGVLFFSLALLFGWLLFLFLPCR